MSAKIAVDLDGTILNYGNHVTDCRVNYNFIGQLIADGVRHIDIITNQGGLVWHAASPEKYPSPARFVERLRVAIDALGVAGIAVVAVRVAFYHPKAKTVHIATVSDEVYFASPDRERIVRYEEPEARKPGTLMFEEAGVTRYYGDSDEDERAAAAHGCEFVRVERFL